MGADVKLRHQSLAFVGTAILFWLQLMVINGNNIDLMSVPERIPIGESISELITINFNNLSINTIIVWTRIEMWVKSRLC